MARSSVTDLFPASISGRKIIAALVEEFGSKAEEIIHRTRTRLEKRAKQGHEPCVSAELFRKWERKYKRRMAMRNDIMMTPEEQAAVQKVEAHLTKMRYPLDLAGIYLGHEALEKKEISLKYLESAVPDLESVRALRQSLREMGYTCFIGLSGRSDNSWLPVIIYVNADRMSKLHKIIEPFTLMDYGNLSISGGEERYFLFFETERDKNACLDELKKFRWDFIHHEVRMEEVYNRTVAMIISTHFHSGLHLVD